MNATRNTTITGGRRGLSPRINNKDELPKRVEFNANLLERIATDLQTKRIPLPRITVSDEVQPGLRAIMRDTGLISFHVSYDVDGTRPFLKIGDHPAMKIDEARELAKTIRALADMGIDPTLGLHERLIRELQAKGTRWRP